MRTISYSRATCFRQCPQKYVYRYIDRIEEEPNEFLTHGKLVHEEIEKYLLHLLPEDETVLADYADQTISSLAPTQTGYTVQIEGEVSKQHDDLLVHGFIDALIETPSGRKTVIDWKTTSRRPQRLMKPEHHEQLLLYGYLADCRTGDTLIVCYPEYQTIIEETYDRISGEEAYEAIIETDRQIRALEAALDTVEGIPTRLCNYCSYKDLCPFEFNKQKKLLKKG